jgi:hypothetical protein
MSVNKLRQIKCKEVKEEFLEILFLILHFVTLKLSRTRKKS